MGPRSFLLHGLLAGLIAGLVALGVAYAVGEPRLEAAIALEGHASGAHGHAADTPADHEHADADAAPVSRSMQSTLGLALGTLVSGVAIGGVLGLVSAAAMGRIGRLGPTASTALVVGLGFASFALVPFAKYPATPPGATEAATIEERTAGYFGFVLLSVFVAVAAVALARRLAARNGYLAVVAAVLLYVVVIATAAVVLPGAGVPATFPAQLLWEFRLSSLLVLGALWGTLALVLAGLVERAWRRSAISPATPVPAQAR